MRIECGVTTEKGPVRSRNEDSFVIGILRSMEDTERESRRRVFSTPCILAVCDGMGGSGYGQEAARAAVSSLSEYGVRLNRVPSAEVFNSLEALIQKVNLEVVALKRSGGKLGTTLAFAYLTEEQIYLANVGDSRIYHYSKGKLKRLSVDHNRYQELLLLTKGRMKPNLRQGANQLTQFIGIDPEDFIIEPHYECLDYSNGLLLLCSDGLTSVVSEEMISQILANPYKESMEEVSERLVQQALKNGSKDNITAMVVNINLESIKGRNRMNKFDPHILEPFWESWYIDSLIGEGSFGYVYKIYKEEFGQKYYSALKIITLPKSEAEAKEILYESTDQETATQYFQEIAEVIFKEIQIMEELKGKTNVVSFEDHKIIRKEDGIGYYIMIRMELLTCLNDYLSQNTLKTRMLQSLAMDMCKALQLCQRRNIIHRDIKPANIFVSADGDFKLGDFGIARQLEGLEAGLSIKGTYSYMAPEVYMGNAYDERADIYSLGMVLYYFLNRKHAPFTDPYATKQRYSEKQEALKRRFSGEELPDPVVGSREFIQVVKKACAYKPEDRYANAGDFLEALMSIEGFADEVIMDPTRMSRTEDTTAQLKMESTLDIDDSTLSLRVVEISAVSYGSENAQTEVDGSNQMPVVDPPSVPVQEPYVDSTSAPVSMSYVDSTSAPVSMSYADPAAASVQMPYADPASVPYQVPYANQTSEPVQMPYVDQAATPYQMPYADQASAPNQLPYADPASTPNQMPYADPAATPYQMPYADQVSTPYQMPYTDQASVPYQMPYTEQTAVPFESAAPVQTSIPVPFDRNIGMGTTPNIPDDEYVNDDDEATVLLTSSFQRDKVSQNEPPVTKKKNNFTKVIAAFIGLAAIAAVVVVVVMMNNDKGKDTKMVIDDGKDPVVVVDPIKDDPNRNTTDPGKDSTDAGGDKTDPEGGKETVPEEVKEYVVEKNAKGYMDYSKIDKLENVTSLTLMNNKLTDTSGLVSAIHLTYLNLEGNSIKDINGLERLTKLEFLNLNKNQVTDISNIKQLSTLNTLILSSNKITDISAVEKLVHLRELRLDGNTKLTDIKELKNLQNLEVLNLSNTSVKDISILYNLKSLTIVDLQNTKVSSKQIKELKKKLPKCNVMY